MEQHHDNARRRGGAFYRLTATAGLLAVTGGIAGVGLNATFTATATATQSVQSGTVAIALGTDGPENRLEVAATDVAPGDTIERAVDLENTGSLDLASVRLSTEALTSSLLDTDAVDGLQLAVERCTVPWTESGTAPAYTYKCTGTVSSVLDRRPVIGADRPLIGVASTTAGGLDHLRFTIDLPSTADNRFQGLTSIVEHTFLATQRTATSR